VSISIIRYDLIRHSDIALRADFQFNRTSPVRYCVSDTNGKDADGFSIFADDKGLTAVIDVSTMRLVSVKPGGSGADVAGLVAVDCTHSRRSV
jgi:hypothetical protein